MYTLIIILCCMGFFMLYNTSARARLSAEGRYQKWLQANKKTAKRSGILLVAASIAMLIARCGWGAGIFTAIILVMAVSGYTVMVAPFYFLKWKHIAGMAAFCLLMELFIF